MNTKSNSGNAIGTIIFYALAVVLFLWTASNTLAFVGRAMPGHPYAKYLALAFFDVGALAWLIVYMKKAQAGMQRGISLLLTGFDLIGALLMVFAELSLSSGVVVAVDLYNVAVIAIGVWTAVNLAAVFAYHLVDRTGRTELEIRSIQDEAEENAVAQLRANMADISLEIADKMGERMTRDVLARLGVDSSRYGLPAGKVIDHKPRKRSIFQLPHTERRKVAYNAEVEAGPGADAKVEYRPGRRETRE